MLGCEDLLEDGQVLRQLVERELLDGGLRRRIGIQIVETEPLKIAGAYRRRLLVGGKIVRLAQCLLYRRHQGSLTRLGLVQTDAGALLLDQETRVGTEHVNVTAESGRMLELRLLEGMRPVQHTLQQIHPESLRLLLLIPVSLPANDKVSRLLPSNIHTLHTRVQHA